MRKAMVVLTFGFLFIVVGCGTYTHLKRERITLRNPNLRAVTIQSNSGTLVRYLYSDGRIVLVTSFNMPKYNISNAFNYDNGSDTVNLGCGIAAAQCALSYFGIDMSRAEINHQYIPTHQVPNGIPRWGGDIWVGPSSLRSGLARALTDAGISSEGLRVVVESGKTPRDVINKLAAGYPVLALVDSGFHYLLVVGYDYLTRQFMVVDNYDDGTNKSHMEQLDLDFHMGETILSFLLGHLPFHDDPNWRPGTIIYFDPRNPPPDCPPGTRRCGDSAGCCSGKCCGSSCCDEGEECCGDHCC